MWPRISRLARRWALTLAASTALVAVADADRRPHAGDAVVSGAEHDGKEIAIDLPAAQHVRNFGAPKDGKGLCVFASLTMDARWHNCRELFDLIQHVDEGGGWPEKVDAILKERAPGLKYAQYEGTDPAVLDKAITDGDCVCVSYGFSERYGKDTIYHMVNLVHIDAETAVVLDNNFPGTYEWMSRDEFLRRWAHPSGKGWAIVMLLPPPPPPPRN